MEIKGKKKFYYNEKNFCAEKLNFGLLPKYIARLGSWAGRAGAGRARSAQADVRGSAGEGAGGRWCAQALGRAGAGRAECWRARGRAAGRAGVRAWAAATRWERGGASGRVPGRAGARRGARGHTGARGRRRQGRAGRPAGWPVRTWVCSTGPGWGFVHPDSVFDPV